MMNSEKNLENNDFGDQAIDSVKIRETLDKIVSLIEPIFDTVLRTVRDIWQKIDGDTLILYIENYKKSEYEYLKKGKRYVKMRRKSSEDISRAFSRKIQHYKKQVQRSLSSK